MAKETSERTLSCADKLKDTKPKRKTKLERTTEAQLFLEQDELQKQLEAEELSTESKQTEVHAPHIVRRLRKL